MTYRWIISPVSNLVIPDPEGGAPDVFRAPRVFEHVDPARGQHYQHSSVIHDGAWCLSAVMADDFTPLDTDAQCISLLETQFGDQLHLDQTPRDLGFTVPHLTRLRNRLEARGVDVSTFTRDTPLADLLQALARALHPRIGDIRRTWLRTPPPALRLPFVEDAIIFQDAFTEASADTNLTAHTPTPTGTSWVAVVTNTVTLQAFFTADDCGASASGASNGQCCKSQPDPSGNEYDVQFTLAAVDTGTATRRLRLHGRLADVNNYYASSHLPTGHASNDTELFKVVTSSKTQLATVDTGIVATDVMMLRMRDVAKSVRKNGAEILTNGDNALTAAGSAALSIGYLTAADSGNAGNVWKVDNYLVDEVAGAAAVASRLALLGVGV